MKPVCVPCKKFYRPKKNGVPFEEGRPVRASIESESIEWKPYKLWSGDLWECLGCGAQIIVGVPSEPLAEHYQERYARTKEAHPPLLLVEDC